MCMSINLCKLVVIHKLQYPVIWLSTTLFPQHTSNSFIYSDCLSYQYIRFKHLPSSNLLIADEIPFTNYKDNLKLMLTFL